MDPSSSGFDEIPPTPYAIPPESISGDPVPTAPAPGNVPAQPQPAPPPPVPPPVPPPPQSPPPAPVPTASAGPSESRGQPVHRPGPTRRPPRTAGWRARIGVVASAALIVAVVLGGGRWVLTHGGSVACPDGDVRLSVVADPAIAPAVAAVAVRLQREHKCVAVKVTARRSAATAAGRLTGGGAPDVWIPDSSLWFDVVRGAANRRDLAERAVPVAASPLIFVLPAGSARSAAADLGRRSWNALTPGRGTPGRYALRLVDPAGTATGAASLLVLQRLAGQQRSGLTATLRATHAIATPDDPGGLAATVATAARRPPMPLLIASEQVVWQQLRVKKGAVTAVYPSGGTAALDFPFVTVGAGNGARKQAAKDLFTALQSPSGAAELHRVGLRTADRAAGPELTSAGLAAATPKTLRPARAGAMRAIRQTWRRSYRQPRVIALIDASASMGRTLPGGGSTTRMRASTQAVDASLALLPDAAEAGLWTTGTSTRPFRQLVSLGPVAAATEGDRRRTVLRRELARLRPGPQGADAGPYDSIRAAYRTLAASYRPDKVNYVLVLTDGAADPESADRLSQLVDEVQRDFDPERPVHVIALGVGADADLSALREITDASNGAAGVPENPELIKDLIVRWTPPRVCDGSC